MKKTFIIILLFIAIIGFQYVYDISKPEIITKETPINPLVIKSFDLGLHSALASFLWINTRTELPFLVDGYEKFENDFNLITELDPKFSTPYAYTVMVLPNTKFKNRFKKSVEIGERGVKNAETNWKIPFYTAVTYHLYLKDFKNAAKYFDIAGHTKGVPDTIRRFSINYGIYPNIRERTKKIWEVIYQNTKNEEIKKRARAYIVHFTILDFLQNMIEKYKKEYGIYPKNIEELIEKKMISKLPISPFGFSFKIYNDGIVGISDE